MDNGNKKKYKQLGMPYGTAYARLRKMVLFKVLRESGKNVCFQCNGLIQNVDDLSLEHKRPWLDSADPIETFFDLENIAFSHIKCNVAAGRKWSSGQLTHGITGYDYHGCRCDKCKAAKSIKNTKRIRHRNVDSDVAAL